MDLAFDGARLAELAQTAGLRLVVLFGSRARGAARPGSDVDIAILGGAQERHADVIQSLCSVFPGHSLDVIRLESADALLRHEVMHRGVRLWGDPVLFSEYRAYAYRAFTDAADLFALERTLFAKKMKRLGEQLHDSR